MRIDSATGTKAWLLGKFSGSFRGTLEGVADNATYAESASQAATASYMGTREMGSALSEALADPENSEILNKFFKSKKLVVGNGIRITSGSLEIDSGSVRIRKVKLEYQDADEALHFLFVGDVPPEPGPTPPTPPTPPVPPPYPPYPPFPPYPPYPPFPPRPRDCRYCPGLRACTVHPDLNPTGPTIPPSTCPYLQGGQ